MISNQRMRQAAWIALVGVGMAVLRASPSTAADPGDADRGSRRQITGVVRGPDGAALAGADVYLVAGEYPHLVLSHKLAHSALPIQQQARPRNTARILGRARTDAAGRFTMEPEPLAAGHHGPRIVVAAKGLGLLCQAWDPGATNLEIRVLKTVPIHGRLFTPSGAPAADVLVRPTWLGGAQGFLSAAERKLEWPSGAKSLVQDFTLDRGGLIHGRVLDGDTGKPIPGASLVYWPQRDDVFRDTLIDSKHYEFRNPALTDSEGRFTLTGLPGPGYLTVETPERIYLRKPRRNLERDDFPMLMGYTPIGTRAFGARDEEVVIRLQRGRTVTLQAVGPSGEELPSVRALWKGLDAVHDYAWNHGVSFPDGKVVVQGIDPSRTTRVFLFNKKRNAGAVFDITAKTADGPIEVRLQPAATVVGQVVTSAGEPVTDAEFFPRISYDPEIKQFEEEPVQYPFYDNFTEMHDHPDSLPSGKFTIENLLPGIRYGLSGQSIKRHGRAMMTIEPLRPGERRDVGKLVLREQE